MRINKLNYTKRLIATAISFISFGVGGVLIRGCYPIIFILPISTQRKIKLGRKIINLAFRVFIWIMKSLGIYTYQIKGLEKLNNSGQLIIANHPTLIDVAFLLSIIKDCNCIVKESLIKNLFTKGPLLTANYIINSSPEKLLNRCKNSLNNNEALLIFPEGTRTKNLKKLKFKKGAANIAILANKNILPILIECSPIMLQKNNKWYKIPLTKPHFIITILDEIDVSKYSNSNQPMSIKTRHLTAELENFFNNKINN